MLILFAALTVFAAIVFLVLGLAVRDTSQMDARLASARGERPLDDYRSGPQDESIGRRVFAPLAESVGTKLAALLPSRWIENIEKGLLTAGQPVTLKGFLFAALLAEGLTLAMGFTIATASGGMEGSKASAPDTQLLYEA